MIRQQRIITRTGGVIRRTVRGVACGFGWVRHCGRIWIVAESDNRWVIIQEASKRFRDKVCS